MSKDFIAVNDMINITKIFNHGKKKPGHCLKDKTTRDKIVRICEKITGRKFKGENVTFTILGEQFPECVCINLDQSKILHYGTNVVGEIANVSIDWLVNKTNAKIDLRRKYDMEIAELEKEQFEKVGILSNPYLNFELDIYKSHDDPRFRAGDVALQLWAPAMVKNNIEYPDIKKLRKVLIDSDLAISPNEVQASDFINIHQLRIAMLRSGSAKAKPLVDWLVYDVMKSIDEKGYYVNTKHGQLNDAQSEIDFLLKSKKSDLFFKIYQLQVEKEEKDEELKEKDQKIECQNNEIKALIPDAEYTRKVLQGPGGYTDQQMAKELGFPSTQQFHAALYVKRIAFNRGNDWFLFAEHCGYNYVITNTILNSDEFEKINLWTEEGRRFLHSYDWSVNEAYQTSFRFDNMPKYSPQCNQLPPLAQNLRPGYRNYTTEKTWCLTDLEYRYNLKAHDMNIILENMGIIEFVDNRYWLTEDYANQGFVEYLPFNTTYKNGEPRIMMNYRWTQKGIQFLDRIFLNHKK